MRSDPREMRILQLPPIYPSAVGRAPPALSMGSAPRFRAPHRVDARGPLASRLPLAKAGGGKHDGVNGPDPEVITRLHDRETPRDSDPTRSL